jgi:hypothetical protein
MATEKQAKVKHDATKDAGSRGQRGHEQRTKATKEMNECNAVVEQTSTACVQVETEVRLAREVLLPIWLRRPGTVRLHKLAALPPHRESSTSDVAGECLAERARGNVLHPRSVASFVPQGNGNKTIRSPVRRCVVRSERRGRACVVCVVTVGRVESGGDVGSRGPEIYFEGLLPASSFRAEPFGRARGRSSRPGRTAGQSPLCALQRDVKYTYAMHNRTINGIHNQMFKAQADARVV